MGSELILTDVPACEITAERLEKLLAIIKHLDDSAMDDTGYEEDKPEEYRERLRAAVYSYLNCHKYRDTVRFGVEGAIYDVYITGTLCFRYPPSNTSDDFDVIIDTPIWDKIREWAISDLAQLEKDLG